jgi:hypothetical protein
MIIEVTETQRDIIKEILTILDERKKEKNGLKKTNVSPYQISKRINKSYFGVIKSLNNLKERL